VSDAAGAPRAARVAAFAAAATLSVTQDVVRAVRPVLGADADSALLAEETLALVATASARAAESGLAGAGAAIAELPLLYHDYLLGAELVAAGSQGEVPLDRAVYERLAHKTEFYGAHLPAGAAGAPALGGVLPLWMGRVSPPKLPTSPDERLAALPVGDMLAVHVRLVAAFARNA